MKKITILLVLMFTLLFSVFAEPFYGVEKLLEDFWNKGQYIKVIYTKYDNEEEIHYLNKSSIYIITLNEGYMRIYCPNVNNTVYVYKINSWEIKADGMGNIIIQ